MPTFDDPAIERMYVTEEARLNKLRSQCEWDEDGILKLPAMCQFCEKPVMDIAMISGDKLPICKPCFERFIGNLSIRENA